MFNTGYATITEFLQAKLERSVHPSSMTDYPESYKFVSFSFFIHPTVIEYDRTTYTLLDLFGDVGGLHDFFILMLTPLLEIFGANRILAILGSSLYTT